MPSVALTIAGSDPSGGAGIQADLKTFQRFGVYGQAVITLITVQNTTALSRVEVLAPELIAAQIRSVAEDIPPHAVKTGALGNVGVIEAVAQEAARLPCPLVIDPVMISTKGAGLLAEAGIEALKRVLLPHAALVTPNLDEAAALAGFPVRDEATMREAARAIAGLGARAVLVKGGHLETDAVDVLFWEGAFYRFTAPRLETRHTHGTGCTYSAAITAGLAQSLGIFRAVDQAKHFITAAIATAPGLGHGSGPVNHLAN